MTGSGYGQQHYHNGSGNNNNSVHGNSTSTNTAAPYIPNATFTAPDQTYNTHASAAAGGGIGGNNNNTFPSSTTQPHPPNINAHEGYNPDFPSAPFSQPANQPPSSAGANWPPSDGLFDLNNVELFAGFDIPFWLDDEQYVPFLDG
jgi:hypothetical protein